MKERPHENLFPRKSLGQVFLSDLRILGKIVTATELQSTDSVLEIGPGMGVLTEHLSKNAKEIFAVEMDKRFHQMLSEKFKDTNVRVIHQNILKLSFENLPSHLIVVGNLPYYISSPILELIIKNRARIKRAFIMVQWEFGKRMIARPHTKNYSSLTCFIEYFTQAKMLFAVGRNSFKPVPKVDSCFMRLDILEKPRYHVTNETLLFKIIHTSFQHRRKTITNAIKSLDLGDSFLQSLESLKLNPNSRPENLTVKNYCDMANFIDGVKNKVGNN